MSQNLFKEGLPLLRRENVFSLALKNTNNNPDIIKIMYLQGVFKKIPKVSNSAPNSKENELRLMCAPSVRF
jgi:hypothetical protein